jgi:hypothetical protein
MNYAGARERGRHAAWRRCHGRRGPLCLRDRVRARNDRANRDLPLIFHSARKLMTAYLLSLALIGLIAIAISEGLS